jgi:hypothetical protein
MMKFFKDSPHEQKSKNRLLANIDRILRHSYCDTPSARSAGKFKYRRRLILTASYLLVALLIQWFVK